MAQTYDPQIIEPKWQQKWNEQKAFHTGEDHSKPKFYGLLEFPYPSGQGLHVGHPRPYTAMDIIARKRRMEGYNVLFPIGFDAFGLPTENYAIKNHVHPAIVTKQNIANFTKQLHMLGYSFDWDRVVDTTDPSYYKWTQWIFLQLFKKGLAYKASMPVNWCTSCKCVLANEEVVNGVCERCGSEVVHRVKSQWMLKITAYADKLIDGLSKIPHCALNGDREHRLPGNVNITFDGVEAETLLLLLDEAKICASAGSACSAGAVEPSHVLLALGLTPAQAKSTLRLTLDAANTAEEIDTAAAVITACVQRLRDGVR